MARLVKVWHVGKISYSLGLLLQKHLASLHNSDKYFNNTLLCLEHYPVYTTGIRSKQYTDEEAVNLQSKGAEFFRTDRGGLITFHGPGQLVVYPILNLKHFKPSIKWYVKQIESTIINVCQQFSLKAETSVHTGVWINDKKVCAIGIHGSRFVTTHGLALNCSTDLTWFDHIVPCGIEGKGVTSLSKELNRQVEVKEVLPIFLENFRHQFSCDLIDMSSDESDEILQSMQLNQKESQGV